MHATHRPLVALSTIARRHRVATEATALAVLTWLIVRVAWMSDDGLINIRSALNLAHGNGAGYNAGERVQAFTSPLWFGLEFGVGALTGEFIVGAILLGAVCAIAAVAIQAHRARSLLQAALVLVVFALSSSLIDYSTSGLENGLAMLLVTIFLVLAERQWSADVITPVQCAVLGAAAAAVVLARYDYVLVVAPPLAVVAWRAWRSAPAPRQSCAALAGAVALPIALWLGVSYAYFGSVVPNTLAAKTNVDISQWSLIGTGLNYLWMGVVFDPVLALAILAGVVLAVVTGTCLHRTVAAGIVLYLVYVVWIGGDFMAGRFLTTPAIAATWLLSNLQLPPLARWTRHQFAGGLLAAAVLLGAWPMIIARPSADSAPRWDVANHRGVADEASFWRHQYGWTLSDALFGDLDRRRVSTPGLAPLRAMEDRWTTYTPPPKGTDRPVGTMCGGLGVYGVSGGPDLYVIDQCALTDAFLAQLPWRMPADGAWRIGHWVRELPDGYLEAVRYADASRVTDPALRARLIEVWNRVR